MGLLIDGVVYPVPGRTVIGPHDKLWAYLSPGDGVPRTRRPSQAFVHKTIADDPEILMPGVGPFGGAQKTAENWASDPRHAGAQMVIGEDGEIACLADLSRFEAWHATISNDRSFGVELREQPGGRCWQATFDSLVAALRVALPVLGIQAQHPRLPYGGQPLRRFADGGTTLVGIFGHRDNTTQRGRWDPGDYVWSQLATELGSEAFDFDAGEDLEEWKSRQTWLNGCGHRLVVDGIPGPATTAALKAEGYDGGIWAFGRRAS